MGEERLVRLGEILHGGVPAKGSSPARFVVPRKPVSWTCSAVKPCCFRRAM